MPRAGKRLGKVLAHGHCRTVAASPDADVGETVAQEVWFVEPGGPVGCFRCGSQAGRDQRLGHGRHAKAVELGHGRTRLHDIELGVGADAGQGQPVDLAEQGPALGRDP